MRIRRDKYGKKRVVHVDIVKMIGIFFVILGHVTLVAGIWPEARNYSYAFHMPLFFFAYGMSQKIKPKYSIVTYKTLLVSRFYGLIVPYLLWGLIYTAFSAKNLGLLLYGTRHSIMRAGSLSSLWFLPTMFVACIYFEIVCHIVRKKPNHKNTIMIIAIAGCIGTLAFSLLLEKCRCSKGMAVIGANTLVIFVVHKAMIEPIIMKGNSTFKNEIVRSIVASLLIFLFSTILALFINRVVPALAGKRK